MAKTSTFKCHACGKKCGLIRRPVIYAPDFQQKWVRRADPTCASCLKLQRQVTGMIAAQAGV